MRNRFKLLPALFLVLMAVAACGPSGSTEPPTVTLTDETCQRAGMETLDAGEQSIQIHNDSGALAVFDLVRLDTSFQEFAAHIAEEQGRIAAGEQPEGPPDSVTFVGTLELNSMGTSPMTETLTPGTYAIVCTAHRAEDGQALAIYVVGPYTVD